MESNNRLTEKEFLSLHRIDQILMIEERPDLVPDKFLESSIISDLLYPEEPDI